MARRYGAHDRSASAAGARGSSRLPRLSRRRRGDSHDGDSRCARDRSSRRNGCGARDQTHQWREGTRALRAGRPRAYPDETRPFLQGARLTAWELRKDRIPVTVIADNMAGTVLRSGEISAVIVGTDRTAANGDVANKIGTYPLAVMANRHGVPFYVAAPLSSIDLACAEGVLIPIEQRSPKE